MTAQTMASKWVERIPPRKPTLLRLFCFHHAGGSGAAFRTWANQLPDDVEICPVQLPGRGRRLNESPIGDMAKLVAAAAEGLLPHLDRPFAFFGHSMGALVAYELASLLLVRYGITPEFMAVAACAAPGARRNVKKIYDLPKDDFLLELRKLGGTPSEVLDHSELLDIVLPILRADFEIIDTHCPSSTRLPCPIAAYGGATDTTTSPDRLASWKECTTGHFSLTLLPGDHFFVVSHKSELLELISRQLAGCECRTHAGKPI